MWAFQTPQTIQQPHLPKPFHKPTAISPKPQCCLALRPSTTTRSNGDSNNNNPLIQSLCKQGNLNQALQVLSQEPNPTQHTYELLILSCTRQNSLPQGIDLHRHLIHDGSDQDPFLATKLINMYSELDSIDNARKVFDKTRKRTIYVWNALFRALTLAGYGREVLDLYRRMNRIGVPSDRFTYTYVLKACVASEAFVSLLLNGREIHGHILRHGFEGHVHIMTTLLDMYARFGCVLNASRVFDQMPVKNVVSWSAMIACYSKNGKPLEALELFRKMMLENQDLLPNSVTMVSVLQACAALAALEQGKLMHGYILRRGLDSILPMLLEARGLQKVPGRSCIEIRRKIYSFMSVDEFNPQIEQLHALLLKLSMEMKEKGYVPDTKVVLYDLDPEEKERIVLGHSEKLALAFGLINSKKGETIRITKNLRLCEDCHSVTKFISKFANREILVRDVNRFHLFQDGVCSCGDYWYMLMKPFY
ncbi:unnamed protein product, partial [Vitis vinifera]